MQMIFGRAARKSWFPPPPADGPPQPEGYWSIIVDENGDRVTNRPPRATDFIARPAVDFIDGGTHPPFRKDPALKDADNLRNLVDYDLRSRKNRDHLKQAVFLLSQTDDGARLLQKAKDLKFSLVFDPALCAEENALGLCDYSQKKIPLAEGRSAAEVALTLKHELQHMEDMSKGLGYGLEDTPKNAQLVNRALEGNARVSEAVAAAEMLMGSPHGPARQFRSAALFNDMWQKNPHMAEAAFSALKDAAEHKWTQFAAKVLPSYFSEDATLSYYDQRYAKYIDKHVPDVSRSMKEAQQGDYRHRDAHKKWVEYAKTNAARLFSLDRWTPEKVAGMLTIRGLPYMQDMQQGKKGFSLAGDAAVSLTAGAPALFEKLKQNILTVLPGSEKPRHLDLPVRALPKVTVPLPSPYAAHATAAQEEAFTPIRLPDRTDGSMLTSGERSNAVTAEILNREYKGIQSGGTDIDRVNYSVGMYFSRNGRIANLRGLASQLVEAGLRAPIGAFPEEYLHDLYGRMALSVRGNAAGPLNLSKEELLLVGHWQQMKDKGMDPAWIDAETKAKSWVADDTRTGYYIDFLTSALKQSPPEPTGLVAQIRPDARRNG